VLDQRPIFVVTAGKSGGGKTTAIKMLCIAVTGKEPAAAAWSSSVEERRKSILGYLAEGIPVLTWDNLPVGATISCPTIDKVTTSSTYSDRVLSTSGNKTVPTYTVFIITGNNVTPAGETASRSLVSLLEVDRPDPENREFSHADPLGWTIDHRGRILSAMYAILVGNAELKKGESENARTRFKTWWRLVGSSVENAAAQLAKVQDENTKSRFRAHEIDFGAIIAATEANDEEGAGVGEILRLLHEQWKDEPFQAADVANHITTLAYSADPEHIEERKTLCAFLDPSGRRGSDISPVTIGVRLKSIKGAPTYVGEHVLTLKAIQGSAKRSIYYRVTIA